jgi:hypothetical protein
MRTRAAPIQKPGAKRSVLYTRYSPIMEIGIYIKAYIKKVISAKMGKLPTVRDKPTVTTTADV